jgi:glucan endo-1,3-beta-D-glucosidase
VGIKILVGIWTEDDTEYANEKGALIAAIDDHSNWKDWIYAVSVDSEDISRGVDPSAIISKILDTRGMLNGKGVNLAVGHIDADIYTSRSNLGGLISASDFIGVDIYSYWGSVEIESAASWYSEHLSAAISTIHRINVSQLPSFEWLHYLN